MMRSIQTILAGAALVTVFAAVAPPSGAEEPSAGAKAAASPAPEARRWPRPGDIQKVFVLKHVGVSDMAHLLSVFPAEISWAQDGSLRALSVSAAPAVVAAIEETIRRLDTPPPATKSVEVTAYVVECATKAADGDGTPAELQDVVTQLRRAFGYTGCGLGPTLFARAAENGRLDTSTRVGPIVAEAKVTYGLQASRVVIDSTQEAPVVRLKNLQVYRSGNANYNGDVDVRSGQRVVVGKLGPTESGRDQILVLTAKVVD